MTIVINTCYGGFHIPEPLREQYGLKRYDNIDRADPRLVGFVREHGGLYEEGCAELMLCTIPDEATDWELNEYDGVESVIAVVDGKIVHLSYDEDEDMDE